jgi:hypothetical protein
MMGDVLPAATPRRMEIDVQGHDELDYVELFCDGASLHKWNAARPGGETPAKLDEAARSFYLRVEAGWGGMKEQINTDWNIDLTIERGEIKSVTPYFSSGPQTVETADRATMTSAEQVSIETTSTRSNLMPTQSAVVEIDANASTILHYRIIAQWKGERYSVEGRLELAELLEDDRYAEISDVFSAPKVKFHRAVPVSDVQFHRQLDLGDEGRWGGPGASYFVKVVQKNGHMAWSSPIWYL